VTAMAAATAAMAAKNAYKDTAAEGANPSINISLTYGHSESKQTQTTENLINSGSVLTGNNINIAATGGGKDSNVDIIGSELNAANNIRLQADNNINRRHSQRQLIVVRAQRRLIYSIVSCTKIKTRVKMNGNAYKKILRPPTLLPIHA
jgi:hypothetical protein